MQDILFQLVLMFGIFVQALVGFGGTLISMPLGIMLKGMDLTKPVMTIVAWLTAVVIIITEHKHINRRELLKMVAVMLVGVIVGFLVSGKIRVNFLLILYGAVIIAIGIRKMFFPPKKESPKAVRSAALGAAGLMQGLFVSGGSFLAVYAVSAIKEKREFRATVNAVWALINTVMITMDAIGGRITKDVLIMSAIAVVPTLAAIWLGGALTKRVKQETFLKIIYVILMVSGSVLLITNL